MINAPSSRETINWREVPQKYWQDWAKAIRDSRDPFLYLSASCPVCQSQALHRWYMVGKPIDPYVGSDEIKYIARGALWVWCSVCGSMEHYSANVPDFWQPPSDFNFDITQLKSIPWPIEDARHEWENSNNTSAVKN